MCLILQRFGAPGRGGCKGGMRWGWVGEGGGGEGDFGDSIGNVNEENT